MSEPTVDYEQVEAMGISRQAYDEVLDIVGRIPTLDELSTLLAMWESNGRQQSLYGWLRGQRHSVERDDYLYAGEASYRAIPEPRIKECIDLAREVCLDVRSNPSAKPMPTGRLLYMLGNVSSEFVGSDYARRCLHLVENPMASEGRDEDCAYIEMIAQALKTSKLITTYRKIADGGLFRCLLTMVEPRGFDVLIPREVRLDAFLFGEEAGRYVVALDERQDDQFLLKMSEARLNCCFLGRTTKGRLMVDGYDFGPTSRYLS